MPIESCFGFVLSLRLDKNDARNHTKKLVPLRVSLGSFCLSTKSLKLGHHKNAERIDSRTS